jgi:hypothetical protein
VAGEPPEQHALRVTEKKRREMVIARDVKREAGLAQKLLVEWQEARAEEAREDERARRALARSRTTRTLTAHPHTSNPHPKTTLTLTTAAHLQVPLTAVRRASLVLLASGSCGTGVGGTRGGAQLLHHVYGDGRRCF